MISKINPAVVRNTYQNNSDAQNRVNKGSSTTVKEQGDTSKVEAIKASIEEGSYKIDLDALAEKIADGLI